MPLTANLTLFGQVTSEDFNATSVEYQRLVELSHRPIKVAIISVLGAMITLGNIAVILVIASSVAGWSRNSRYFLMSLTGADTAFGLIVMPLNLCVSLLKDYSDGPDPLCHVVAFVNSTIYATCMYTLATISIERYVAVFYPLKYSSVMTRNRTQLLIAFAWFFPPILLLPISFPNTIIEVHFSTASLVCNPSYSSNVGYSLTLTGLIFFPCSTIMTYANLRLWLAAKKQRIKLSKHEMGGRDRPDVASRVLVPVMTVYYACWTPCMVTILYNAISGSAVPEWVEFVAVWLPTANGFLNCIFYFWINRSFRRKFRLVAQRLCLCMCPQPGRGLRCSVPGGVHVVASVWDNNNCLQERSASVSSTCTLITLAMETHM
ncbi:adenosine receptor A2b isoform X1 [Brienomyrus brachyistius]|uniref:adenosine receptor A2b isoform X1 n=2 Tax=Brienomyrus brachyistius TaxID=42636 RepID=UPI0020B19590|nr:adenosine receptor A2b isoform X1 [Brienomyrus brachyistius]